MCIYNSTVNKGVSLFFNFLVGGIGMYISNFCAVSPQSLEIWTSAIGVNSIGANKCHTFAKSEKMLLGSWLWNVPSTQALHCICHLFHFVCSSHPPHYSPVNFCIKNWCTMRCVIIFFIWKLHLLFTLMKW